MTRPTFYVDETYGPRLVALLREMNLDAVTFRDVPGIESGDRDVDSIPHVAARRWIGVTGDKRLRRRPVELHAIQNARLGLVVVATRLSTENEAPHVIDQHRDSFLALAHYMPGPYVISLTRQHVGFTWLGENQA